MERNLNKFKIFIIFEVQTKPNMNNLWNIMIAVKTSNSGASFGNGYLASCKVEINFCAPKTFLENLYA